MDVKFTKKQKQYIEDRIKSSKEFARKFQIKYDSNREFYRMYLLSSLESVLSDLCGKSAFELFDN